MSSFFPQSTFFGLELMSTSLQSFSVAENVTGDNISNVNTPGATQQQTILTEAPPIVGSPFTATHVPGTAGEGVIVSGIQRVNVQSYDALFRGASSSQNYYSTQQQILTSVQSQLGDPTAGVSTSFTNFQTALTNLVNASATGSTLAAASGVLTTAQSLAQSLGNSSSAISNAENQTLSQGATIVQTVNGLLDQIAALNGQIRSSTAVGDNPEHVRRPARLRHRSALAVYFDPDVGAARRVGAGHGQRSSPGQRHGRLPSRGSGRRNRVERRAEFQPLLCNALRRRRRARRAYRSAAGNLPHCKISTTIS